MVVTNTAIGQSDSTLDAFAYFQASVDKYYEDSMHWSSQMSLDDYDHWMLEMDTFYQPLEIELSNSKILELKRNWGLRLESSANHYFREVSDLENNNPLQTLASAGFSWNTLKGGWRASRLEAEQQQIMQEIELLEQNTKAKTFAYEHLYNRILYWNHLCKREALNKRLNFLEAHIQWTEGLYLNGELKWEEKSKLEEERSLVKIDILSNEEYIRSFEAVYPYLKEENVLNLLPEIQLNIDSIHHTASNILERKLNLHEENLALTASTNKMPSLSLRTRMNYRQSSSGSEMFPSIGFQLQLPIDFSKKGSQIQQLEFKQIEQRERWAETSRQKELMNAYYEFQFKRKHYVHYQKEMLLLEEKIYKSQLAYEEQLKTDFFWVSVQLLHQKQKMALARLDVLKDMHLQLLKIYTLSHAKKPSSLIKKENRQRKDKVLVLIKDLPSALSDIDFLTHYLRVNQWKDVTFIGVQMPSKTVRSMFYANQIRIHSIMIGRQAWQVLNPNDFDSMESLKKEIKRLQNSKLEGWIVIDDAKELIHLDSLPLTQQSNEEF